jgi:hypothetical protein
MQVLENSTVLRKSNSIDAKCFQLRSHSEKEPRLPLSEPIQPIIQVQEIPIPSPSEKEPESLLSELIQLIINVQETPISFPSEKEPELQLSEPIQLIIQVQETPIPSPSEKEPESQLSEPIQLMINVQETPMPIESIQLVINVQQVQLVLQIEEHLVSQQIVEEIKLDIHLQETQSPSPHQPHRQPFQHVEAAITQPEIQTSPITFEESASPVSDVCGGGESMLVAMSHVHGGSQHTPSQQGPDSGLSWGISETVNIPSDEMLDLDSQYADQFVFQESGQFFEIEPRTSEGSGIVPVLEEENTHGSDKYLVSEESRCWMTSLLDDKSPGILGSSLHSSMEAGRKSVSVAGSAEAEIQRLKMQVHATKS